MEANNTYYSATAATILLPKKKLFTSSPSPSRRPRLGLFGPPKAKTKQNNSSFPETPLRSALHGGVLLILLILILILILIFLLLLLHRRSQLLQLADGQ